MNSIQNYKDYLKRCNNPKSDTYLITGKDRTGKRIKIETKTPKHFNIYQGSLWLLGKNNKKTLIKRYYNY